MSKILKGSVVEYENQLWIVLANTERHKAIPLINEIKTDEIDCYLDDLKIISESYEDKYFNLKLDHPTIKLEHYKEWFL